MIQQRTEWRAEHALPENPDGWCVEIVNVETGYDHVIYDCDEPTARLIAAANDMALTLTLVAEACEENLADHRAGKFLVKEWAPFLESTGNRAIAALRTAGRIPK